MTLHLDDIDRLGTVLTVWAHPDDETYLAGGLMAATSSVGQRVACVIATAGERGTSDPTRDPPAALATRRRRELQQAMAKLGVHEHVIFGAPDGGCAELKDDAPIVSLVRCIEHFAPDTVVTFGPDGITGHPDHRTVSRWVDLAIAATDHPTPRLLHATMTPEFVDEFADVDEMLGVYVDLDGGPATTARDALGAELVLGPYLLARKLAALRAHASQTDVVFDLLGMQRMADWVRVETFVDPNTP